MAITANDLARLIRATARPAADLVSFLGPTEVDMRGEPASFIELSVGRRLMVLAQDDGACRLLGADNRCSVYAARPRDCRTFPFDFGLPHARRELTLLPLASCEFGRASEHDERALRSADEARWAELAEYQALVARWNRRAFHRRRLGRSSGSAAEYLTYALANAGTAAW